MTYLIKEQRTRFIYPFSFEPLLQATQLIAALETLHYREKPVWQRVAPHHFYTRETLDLVNNFLFMGGPGGGTYFKVTAEVAATWFQLVPKWGDRRHSPREFNGQVGTAGRD